tara:strand:+ start:3182 stop:3520 length:339 start_codon:yes stop_codon:yes gene_type:complete
MNEENITILEYLKNNYDIETLLENDKIHTILSDNHKRNFTQKYRHDIEMIKQKYINLYQGAGLFKNDLNNANWERLFDIVYENVNKKYDLGMIYDDPHFFIDILENKNIKKE